MNTESMKPLAPLDFGTPLTVETCQKIRIDDLLKQCREEFKEAMMTSKLNVMGINVELIAAETQFNGIRFWFKCPQCERRIGVLFRHPISQSIGCRLCLHLRYRKQRYKGMAEGL